MRYRVVVSDEQGKEVASYTLAAEDEAEAIRNGLQLFRAEHPASGVETYTAQAVLAT
jgi:hypothetical protein